MKKILFIIFLFFSLISSATNYYVDPNGSDDTGNGSAGNPWYSLSHACSVVTTSGDKIFVNAGSYTDNNKCVLSLGVLIEGDLNSPFSIITTSYVASGTADAYIVAASPPGNAVNGNQSISYIRINGNSSTATRAIYTAFRSNVIIHHCTFTNFHYQGIRLNGTISAWNVTPTNITPTNNEMHDCTFTNCANLEGNDGGHIRPEGQNGLKIYNNILTQTGAPLGHNTDIFAGYQNEGLEIYNNVFYKNDYENNADNFFAEIHYSRGGFQMYGNTFNGAACFDYSGSVVGTWGFGGRIYDNTFQTSTAPPYDSPNHGYLDLETFTYENDVYVYRNHFKFCRKAIGIDNIGISANNIWIYDNIIEDVGNTSNSWSSGIKIESNWNSNQYTSPIDNIYIYNNVIDAGASALGGINTYVCGTITNMNIRNNIIRGNFDYPIMFNADQDGRYVNTLNINNNIFYGCIHNSISYMTNFSPIYTNRNDAGNFVADPLFVDGSPYDFHLSSAGSPAYHAGIYVSLPMGNTDYDLVAWNNPPSIGTYEYGGAPPPPAGTAYSRRSGKYVMKFGKIIRR